MKFENPRAAGVVLGNGPSAKLTDFDALRSGHIASVGMNAAYRYWDQIDFRPTHYICMDTVVIQSHAKRIMELVDEGRIEKFFLRDEIKDLYPELEFSEKILWFRRAREKNLPLFQTNLITTGSWAVRWLVYEGVHTISIVGIDANYVELVPEAKKIGESNDSRLVISKTPEINPNYFIPDYQRSGDQYNIPNNPGYQKKTGELVHVDALRAVKVDIDSWSRAIDVVDASPISNHEIFEKQSFNEFLGSLSCVVVTSFHCDADKETLLGNVQMALKNADNAYIANVTVVLEGSKERLCAHLPQDVSSLLRKRLESGAIRLIEQDRRPNYFELFSAGNAVADNVYIVANSDVEFDIDSVAEIMRGRRRASGALWALTRWNKTDNGLFIQSVSWSAPWAEIPISELTYRERNFLSYDTYVADVKTPIAPRLSEVLIGTFGCDTAVAALARLSNVEVCNPCLAVKTIHHDEKVRDYKKTESAKNMRENGNIVAGRMMERTANAALVLDSLRELSEVRACVVSFGRPHEYGVWQSLFRLFGSTPWRCSARSGGVEFVTVRVDLSADDAVIEEKCNTIAGVIEDGAFLSLEVTGDPLTERKWLDGFRKNSKLAEIRERLFRYDWHSVLLTDKATANEKRIHHDVDLFVRDVMAIGQRASSAVRSGDADATEGCNKGGASNSTREKPKVLVVDSTRIGSTCATGHLKGMLFEPWEAADIAQLYTENGVIWYADISGARVCANGQDIADCVHGFAPELIYVRPTESEIIIKVAFDVLWATEAPVIVHVMDDWPKRLEFEDGTRFRVMDSALRALLSKAAYRLAISDEMCDEYKRRYGVSFTSVANGVEVEQFRRERTRGSSEARAIRVRYFGGLARDMTLDSVIKVAKAVSELAKEIDISFDVFTMPWYIEMAQRELEGCRNVEVKEIVSVDDYPVYLANADIAVLAYNFDVATRRYVGLSFPNKLPELLASGVPVIAVGPDDFPAIRYLKRRQCANVVTENDVTSVRRALCQMVGDPEYLKSVGEKGRKRAAEDFSKQEVHERFMRICVNASRERSRASSAVVGKGGVELRRANRMARDGRYQQARDIYVWLSLAYPRIAVYHQNLEWLERRVARSRPEVT